MRLEAAAYFRFTSDLTICRLLSGLWQVAGGHGRIDMKTAVADMVAYHQAGFPTWDLADHYGPAEDLVGAFRRRLRELRGADELAHSQAFTKWVPRPGPMSDSVVDEAIGTSLRRMGVPVLDLVQFHWWRYDDPRYLDALTILAELRDQGKIRHLGLTNFDTAHVEQIVATGVPIVSNQVQMSLLDRRPRQRMIPFCRPLGIHLLTYGTLLGGFLTDRYLGRPEPRRTELSTWSLGKYKEMIDLWGGWALFQELLAACRKVADRHEVSIANVAVRAVLEEPGVGGVIVGARLGLSEHRAENARVFSFSLTAEDRQELEAVAGRGQDLLQVIGDCGDEYRR